MTNWLDEDCYPDWYQIRSQWVSGQIKLPSKIVEIGPGPIGIKPYLHDGVSYISFDLKKWTNETFLVDLNDSNSLKSVAKKIDKNTGVVMLGVLEYLTNPLFVLKSLMKGKSLVFSYCHSWDKSNFVDRESRGWTSNLSEFEIIQFFMETSSKSKIRDKWNLKTLGYETKSDFYQNLYYCFRTK